MRTLNIAMLGFGNAGQAFAKLLMEKHREIRTREGFDIHITAIVTGSRGSLVNNEGIDLEKACSDITILGKLDSNDPAYSQLSSFEIVDQADYDMLIELTPLAIFSGQPAIRHIKGAFARGKHVITANKGPIAWAYRELKEMAASSGSLFFYETTVMDGTPIFNLVEDTLKYCKVIEVSGILNSTTNFILEELAGGKPYDQVINEGMRRGFIEADPAMDIEGWDAAAKITALLNVLMDANITPRDIDRAGIENISLSDIEEAAIRGNVIKLLCRGAIENGKVSGSVKPVEISRSDLLAGISGTSSIVSITTDLMGKISIIEHDPEIEQTGYGIFSDLIRMLENMKTKNK